MAFKFIDNKLGLDDPTSTYTYATSANVYLKYPLGFTAAASDGTLGYGVFVHAVGGANVSASNAVVFRGQTVSALATASNGSAGRVGIAHAAISATNVGGWVQVYGFAPAIINSTGAEGQQLKIGSTAGRFEVTGPTATTFANPIDGAYLGSSCSASTASGVVFLNFPSVRGA